MGSAGKTAFGVILGIGAVTGVLCYYAFGLVAPEPGVMTYVSREPPPAGSAAVPSGSSSDSGGEGSGGNQAPASSSPANNGGENATQNVTSSSAPGPSSAEGGANDTGSNTTTPAATTTAAAATLAIPNGASVQGNPAYEPSQLTVKVGDTIAVENKDTTPHTVTNGKDATDPTMGKLFDTSIINAGDSAEIVTASMDPGEYAFFCSVHPYMTGTLTVQ
jgi:cytochrome c oxidase subunit II